MAGPDRTVRVGVLLSIIALDLLAGTSLAHAATWTGGSGDFGTAANWNPHTVPGGADTATINSGIATVTTSVTVGTVNIGAVSAGDAGTVSVSGSGSLGVTTLKVNSGGTLDIGSGRSVTASATTIAGTVQGAGTLNAGTATQSDGTLDVDSVTATTYTLKGTGEITGGEVGFSDSFALQVTGKVASGVELTGDGSATMTQAGTSEMAGIVTGVTAYTQSGGEMSGSVTVDGTYTQSSGTMSGSVDSTDYKLSGGSVEGTVLDNATVDFSGAFTMSGNSTIGANATVTGDADATFTQSNGQMLGSASVQTYTQSGGTVGGAVDTVDYKLSGGSIKGTALAGATVGYTGTFTLSGSGTIDEYATVTGDAGSTFTQINGTVLGSVSADTYTQSGGFMSGTADAADYKLSGGSIIGTALVGATADFTDSFTLSGSGTIGAYATVTGGTGATFTQTNGTVLGSVSADTYAQQGGKMQGAVVAGAYKLSGGSIIGTALVDATVDFTDSFTLSGSGTIGAYATVTGGTGATFTQTNGTVLGSVAADTYAQQGGKMQGAVDADAYKLTGGSIGTELGDATVDFSGSFAMSGNSIIGTYATITGGTGAAMTQNNGQMLGVVEADSYELTGGSLDGSATVDSFVLANEGGNLQGKITGSVDFGTTFEMSGNTAILADATVTGAAGSVFTHDAGTIYGDVLVDTYAIDACFVTACATVADSASIDAATAFDITLAAGEVEVAGKLTGTGELKKSGGSTLVLSNADNDFSGATTVTGGVLQVDGAISASATTVSGGTLAGVGSLGVVTVASGGTHLAGKDGDGTQTINGNYANHGTLAVELTPATAGKVVVNGTVDIAAATLDLRQLTGDGWAPTSDFTLIDNDGDDAVVGSFASIESRYAFLVPGISTDGGDGNDVVLTLLRNDVGFSQVGATDNQRAAAAALESLGAGNPLFDGMLWLTDEQAQQAFADLSGEAFASAKGALLSTATLTSDALLDRAGLAFNAVGTAEPSGYADTDALPGEAGNGNVWTTAYGAWHQTDADASVAATHGTAAGIVAGVDTELAGWTVGVAAGAGQSGLSVPDLNSDFTSTDLMLGAYAGAEWSVLELALGASYTRHLVSSQRGIDFPAPQELTADYGAGTTQIFGRLGVPIDLGVVELTPFGEAGYARLDTDGFSETGGAAALSSAASTTDAAQARLGVSLSATQHISDGMLLRLTADAAWQHGSGATPTATNSFTGSDAFTVTGAATASDMLTTGLALDLDATDTLQFHLAYDGTTATDATSHRLSAAIVGGF